MLERNENSFKQWKDVLHLHLPQLLDIFALQFHFCNFLKGCINVINMEIAVE